MFGFGKITPEETDPLEAELKRLEEQKRRMYREIQNLEEKLQLPSEPPRQDMRATFKPRTPLSNPNEPKQTLLKVEQKNLRNHVIIVLIGFIILLAFVIRQVISLHH